MQRQMVKEPARANVRLPADLLAEIDRLAGLKEMSRATLMTRLLRAALAKEVIA